MMNKRIQLKSGISGFTIIEIAIVLLIVTIVLGYTVALFPKQEELRQYKQAEKEMDALMNALYAFAQTNSYLPCPANNNIASSGFECRDIDSTPGNCDGSDPQTDECDLYFGYIPGKTLGFDGKYSDLGLLLDPWGQPYRYQVAYSDDEDTDGDGDRDGDSFPDMVIQGGIQFTSRSTITINPASNIPMNLSLLSPDLVICNTDPSATGVSNETECTDASETTFGTALTTPDCDDPDQQCSPVVILSTGKDKLGDSAGTSWVQRENLDNSLNDTVYVKTTFSEDTGSEYDDLVKWMSPNILYSKMIEAGQLP